jgi:glutathione S-transferase
MAESLTLYVETLWISPYTFSSFVALREKGLAFESVEVALYNGEHRRPEFTTPSVTAKVPALKHRDFWLAESSAIAEYLDEAFPAPTYRRLLPEPLRERARARQLMAWLRSDLGALREEHPTTTIFYEPATAPLSKAGEKAKAELIRVASSVVPENAGPLFDSWSLVDSELAFMLHRLIANKHDLPDVVRAFADREWQRPAARAFIEHARPSRVPDAYWRHSGLPPPGSSPVA